MREKPGLTYTHTVKNTAVYENMAPMKIFAAKRAELTGRWRKVDNEESDNLYSLSSIRHSS